MGNVQIWGGAATNTNIGHQLYVEHMCSSHKCGGARKAYKHPKMLMTPNTMLYVK